MFKDTVAERKRLGNIVIELSWAEVKGKKIEDVELKLLLWLDEKFKAKNDKETETLKAIKDYLKLPLIQQSIEEQEL